MENEEAGDRRQFQAAASNVQNIHPRPAEAGLPRQRGTQSSKLRILLIVRAEPVEASFSL